MGTSADNDGGTGSWKTRGARQTQREEESDSAERTGPKLGTDSLIAKKKRVARTNTVSKPIIGSKAHPNNDVSANKPKKTPGNNSVASVLKASLSEQHNASSQLNTDLKNEVEGLRTDISDLKGEYVRRNNQRILAEQNRKEAEEKKEARYEKMLGMMKDLLHEIRHNGSSSDSATGDGNVSIYEKGEAIKEFVKLYTSIEILDPTRGSHIFGGSCTNHLLFDDGPAVVDGAKFILGPTANVDDISQLLNEELTIKKKDRAVKQRIGSFAAQGQCRAHDNIRNKMIDAFLSHLPGGHPLRIGSTATKEEKKDSAILMFNSGHYRTDSNFQDAWFHAWYAARSEAHSTAVTSFQQLTAFSAEGALLDIPQTDLDIRSTAPMSIYSLGFMLMKVTKAIRGVAGIRARGMKLSHKPAWARETIHLNSKLQSAEDCTDDMEDDIGDGAEKTLVFGMLVVHKLLTEEEETQLSTLNG